MSSCMPKEQQEYLDNLANYMLEATNMSKEETESFAFRLWQFKDSDKFKKLAFDNPPLKFEDFKIKTPYWDNKFKQWCFVIGKHSDEILETYIFRDPPIHRSNYFEEGRFYLREVKE